ncbi:MAG TPA: hypothetical protein VND99_04925 [Candidatus Acidoferrales bacterium]|nr:hypothetical protein [Candidatus Acidoferrales bacterium]
MTRKIFFFIFGIILTIILIIIGTVFFGRRQTLSPSPKMQKTPQIANSPSYTIVDSSSSPKSAKTVTQDKIFREAGTSDNSLQRFVIKSSVDGSIREIFGVNESDITFEKIQPENWSPTNKFLFVFIDYSNRRDVIFLKTDGKFTNGNYYLHSTGLYPNMNVLSATWIDTQTLELQTKDINTNLPQKYLVNFDDDTGIVTPESK